MERGLGLPTPKLEKGQGAREKRDQEETERRERNGRGKKNSPSRGEITLKFELHCLRMRRR